MLKCCSLYQPIHLRVSKLQVYVQFCHNYSSGSEKHRSLKELKKFYKQQRIAKNIKLATENLRPHIKPINFDESVYDKIIQDGEKKDVSLPLPKKFSPQFVEKYWYNWWVKKQFNAPRKTSEKVFSMVIPPPNVTGKLHLGHALTCAIEDTLIRWQSMLGNEAVWIPGCDHAGIATQLVVEQQLERDKGENRSSLGRKKFCEAIWQWKENKGNHMYQQLERLGASLDWNRSVFTLDDKYCHAVKEAFIRLFNEGIIYRDERCINWCCHLQSTISDLEVRPMILEEPTSLTIPGYDDPVQFGTMHRVAYKLQKPVGDVDEVVVATTRLETIVGDEAVAVHPDDPRYSSLIGELLFHPLNLDKLVPIIADSAVEMDFGTGAMKVTPAHDFLDFEIGKRHNLPISSVINAAGCVETKDCRFGSYDQKPRFFVRNIVLNHLLRFDLYRGSQSQQSVVRLCARSGDIIEPMVKEQWFVRVDEMAQQASDVIDDGSINFIQKSMYEKSWKNWLKQTGSWCISRQIWWGHQVPAYHCSNNQTGETYWVAAHNQSEAMRAALVKSPGASESDLRLVQDGDVLDTWFSSALHPFASLGWPEETEDMKRYYPLSLMETGNDLIFFWVARMVMLGMKLTGQVPFKSVLFHPMVRDQFNRKMSKSVGNVIDPIHVIDGASMEDRLKDLERIGLDAEEDTKKTVKEMWKENHGIIPQCGSDALRLALLSHSTEVSSLRFEINQAVVARKFCNKVWNCSLFCFKYMKDDPTFVQAIKEARLRNADLHPMEAWVRSRLFSTVQSCNDALAKHRIHDAVDLLKKFWLNISDFYLRYCYFYLSEGEDPDFLSRENAMPDVILGSRVSESLLASDRKMETVAGMIDVVEVCLRLLCPFAPFLAEELWQRIPKQLLGHDSAESVTVSSFPVVGNIEAKRDLDAEAEINRFLGVNEKVNHEKIRYYLPRTVDVICVCRDDKSFDSVGRLSQMFTMYFNCNSIEVHKVDDLEELKRSCFGIILDTDDVIVLYRLSPEHFADYLNVTKIESKLQRSRDVWIKLVEKYERLAKRNPEKLKSSCDKIIDESEKYEKIEMFSKSFQFVKSNMQVCEDDTAVDYT